MIQHYNILCTMSDSKTKYKIENISKKDLIVYHHLGLGDHIVMNGLINYMSKASKEFTFQQKANILNKLNTCMSITIKLRFLKLMI